MCLCYAELFESNEENKYVKKLVHFYCKCEDEHEYFVHICKGHPFIYLRLHGMKYKCDCKNIGPFDTCDFCIQIRYLVNFRCLVNFVWKKFRKRFQVFWFLSILIWNMKLQNANRFF